MCKEATCPRCKIPVNYILKDGTMSGTYLDLKIDFVGSVPFCPLCDTEIDFTDITEVIELNLDKVYDKYTDLKSKEAK